MSLSAVSNKLAVALRQGTKQLEEEIQNPEQTIEKAEDNLFEGKIDANSFVKGKAQYKYRITDLKFEMEELKKVGINFMSNINKCLAV